LRFNFYFLLSGIYNIYIKKKKKMTGKRKRQGYVDRDQINAMKKMNISEGLKAEKTSNNFHSIERHFSHKLVKYTDDGKVDSAYCEVMVMLNDICVLVAPNSSDKVPRSISYRSSIGTDKVSGKRKKGAFKSSPGCGICTVTYDDSYSIELKTPIGGQVLELNENLLLNPNLLNENPVGEGYLAIIFPNSKLPSI
jgi:hypothetical protein